ncbi:energy transducer TonB [Marinibactrum halimedae]|uniref:Protein TonB n=1 Tax=Marinibactrum halimedae TaxID=1444977 RepID=A0AA37T550_9GAMM|nr:energy transducer TonB [Marinibactrum halimedae]MCD9458343.1 TonB family protein [Marinibactrum halimedae]GLS27029.1 hypothetical protein GCM10007877_27480 [Marinibactrum halimedae]
MITAATARPEVRVISVIPAALLITAFLFAAMISMVNVEFEMEDPVIFTIPDPIAVPPPMPKPLPEPKPVKPPEPLEVPDVPAQTTEVDLDPMGLELGEFRHTGNELKPQIGSGAGILMKQVMVPPVYPRRALMRGMEGFVDVKFDVTAHGVTKNISVLQAQPEGVFEDAALKAVKRWRYRPRNEDGAPVPTYDLRERISFKIEK